MSNALSYIFPLDNLIEREIKDIKIIENPENIIIDFDIERGSYIKFNKDCAISKTINEKINNRHIIINFYVKFDAKSSKKEFFQINESIFSLDPSILKQLKIKDESLLDWYNFTIEIVNNKISAYLFNKEIKNISIDDNFILGNITLKGELNSFSTLLIKENLEAKEIDNIKNIKTITLQSFFSKISFNFYISESLNKEYLFLNNDNINTKEFFLEIDFSEYVSEENSSLDLKDAICRIKTKKGFFNYPEELESEEKSDDFILQITKEKSTILNNKLLYKIDKLEYTNLTNQNQILVQIELFNIKINDTNIIESYPIIIDRVIDIKDERGINSCPFDCYINDDNLFSYNPSSEARNLEIILENKTVNPLNLIENKTTFSIDLSQHNLFKIDTLQSVNCNIKSNGDKKIRFSLNSNVLKITINEAIILNPQEYISIIIKNLIVAPSEYSAGNFQFNLYYKHVDIYQTASCKINLNSTIKKTEDYLGNWKDGQKSGKGIENINNEKYEGEFLNGKRHGYGKLTNSINDIIYEGTWENGEKKGYGKGIENINNEKYEGEFLNGKRHGYGKLTNSKNEIIYEGTWENGEKKGYGKGIENINNEKYEGEFLNDKRHGYGKLTNSINDIIYEGTWKNGAKNGYGKGIENINYDKYEGDFLDGKRHGNGKLTNSKNEIIYEGTWKNGAKNGYGESFTKHYSKIEIYKGKFLNGQKSGKGIHDYDGERYDGDFLNDKRHGNGILTDYEGNKIYEGSWKDGQKSGKGIQYSSSERYEGDFLNDKRHGNGVLTGYQGKKNYEGAWKDGKKSGKGIQYYETDKYEGEFLDDQRNGNGTVTNSINEIIYKGTWKNNIFWEGKITFYESFRSENQFWNSNISNSYRGTIKDGKYNGKGRLKFTNNDEYDGEFLNGKRHGIGCYTWYDIKCFYNGKFLNDKAVDTSNPHHSKKMQNT